MSYTIDPSKVDKDHRVKMPNLGIVKVDQPDRIPGTTKVYTYCGSSFLASKYSTDEYAFQRAAIWLKDEDIKTIWSKEAGLETE